MKKVAVIRLSFDSSVIECFGDMLHQLPVNEIRARIGASEYSNIIPRPHFRPYTLSFFRWYVLLLGKGLARCSRHEFSNLMLPHCYLKMYTKMLLEDSTSAAKRFHQETAELLLSKEARALQSLAVTRCQICGRSNSQVSHSHVMSRFPRCFLSQFVSSSDIVEKEITILHDQHLANPNATNSRDLESCWNQN